MQSWIGMVNLVGSIGWIEWNISRNSCVFHCLVHTRNSSLKNGNDHQNISVCKLTLYVFWFLETINQLEQTANRHRCFSQSMLTRPEVFSRLINTWRLESSAAVLFYARISLIISPVCPVVLFYEGVIVTDFPTISRLLSLSCQLLSVIFFRFNQRSDYWYSLIILQISIPFSLHSCHILPCEIFSSEFSFLRPKVLHFCDLVLVVTNGLS